MSFVTFLILSLASYRITRFFLFDTMFEGTRLRLHAALISGTTKDSDPGRWASFKRLLANKLFDLTSCSWCLSVWVSLGVLSVYLWECPLDWERHTWVLLAGLSGASGLIHALEPAEDE